ncbi:uncharacterized protein TNCT_80231 [Trichonephila clavata]|uniref:Uncharacterized protein n=1 Tax=Trichonephila clavata TaxID=2740835 RepID=A0A8X6LDF6_TRICU|nr:uncharacterized protein TNCT_80231 [Trichonephila clavata]
MKNEDSSIVPEVTSLNSIIVDEDIIDPDALTADIDFNSSMSLEVNDTVDSFLTDSEMRENSLLLQKEHVIVPQNTESHSVVKGNAEVVFLTLKYLPSLKLCYLIHHMETILLESENTEELSDLKEFPISEGVCVESNSSRQYKCSDDFQSNIELIYSFHSNIGEAVKDIKLVYFNHSNYAFIQHITWIQAWRQEKNKVWTKIFSHKVGEVC